MPDDTTEGLRERLKAAFDNFTCEHSRSECADCLADTAVAALSRMVDPVDLPARMAEAAKDAFCGGDKLPDGTRLLSDLRSPWRALDDALAAALSVRWEAAVQASAAADELRRQLADAEAELQGRTERAWQAQRERDEARREVERLQAAIERVRAVHVVSDIGECTDCRASWPCPTVAALDGGE